MLNELSLFTGYGGFSLGLRLAGLEVRTVGYCEIEKYCQEIIKARIKDGYLDDAPIFPDIRAFDGKQYGGLVDIVTGGFPCQPHSVAGRRKGKDDARNLWPDTLRIISEVGPRFAILENVPGILSNGYGGVVIGQLSEMGYHCIWGIVAAADVGATHNRERWWCLATLANPDRLRCDDRPTNIIPAKPRFDALGNAGSSQPALPSMADAGSIRRDSRRDADGRDEVSAPEIRQTTEDQQSGTGWLNRTGEGERVVGNPHNTRLEGRRGPVRERPHEWITWPPSPQNDGERWQYVFERWPALAPAVEYPERGRLTGQPRRGSGTELADRPLQLPGQEGEEVKSLIRLVADGSADRVGQLKALGNGIVPAVVAEFLYRVGFLRMIYSAQNPRKGNEK